jgi:hypothetical protein
MIIILSFPFLMAIATEAAIVPAAVQTILLQRMICGQASLSRYIVTIRLNSNQKIHNVARTMSLESL